MQSALCLNRGFWVYCSSKPPLPCVLALDFSCACSLCDQSACQFRSSKTSALPKLVVCFWVLCAQLEVECTFFLLLSSCWWWLVGCNHLLLFFVLRVLFWVWVVLRLLLGSWKLMKKLEVIKLTSWLCAVWNAELLGKKKICILSKRVYLTGLVWEVVWMVTINLKFDRLQSFPTIA